MADGTSGISIAVKIAFRLDLERRLNRIERSRDKKMVFLVAQRWYADFVPSPNIGARCTETIPLKPVVLAV